MTESFDEKTARNIRVQHRYDALMAEGKHGHYETMFRVVREEVEAARAAADQPCPEGWVTQELERLFTASAGEVITLDMKQAANVALKVARGERWDNETQAWVAASPAAAADLPPLQPPMRHIPGVRVELLARAGGASPAAAAGVPRKVIELMLTAAADLAGWAKQHGDSASKETAARLRAAALAASPVAPVGAPTRLTDEQIVKIAVQTFGKYAYEARSLFIQYANELLSVRPGCELATAAREQRDQTDSSHLAAPQNDQDVRDGQELPTAAPQVGEPGLQDIFRNPALLKMPGEEWEFDDDTAVKWAWFAHGQHTGMTAYFSGAQLRAAFNAGSGQDFRRRPASSEAAPSAEESGGSK